MSKPAILPACCGPECARREFLRDAAIAAARQFAAALHRAERRERAPLVHPDAVEHWETLLDALLAERRSR